MSEKNVKTRKNLCVLWRSLFFVFISMGLYTGTSNAVEVQRKPRMLIILDTSGSMAWDAVGTSTNGDGSNDPWWNGRNCCKGNGGSRIYAAKEAIRAMAFGTGEIEFGLMTYPQIYYASGGATISYYRYNETPSGYDSVRWDIGPSSGCDYVACDSDPNCHYMRVGFGGANETTNNPAEIEMWVNHHEYSKDPAHYGSPDSNALASDGTEQEIRAEGNTPIDGALTAANTYLLAQRANDNSYVQSCRPYSVVLIADGDETCGGTPVTPAGTLYSNGFKVWAINFVGGSPAVMDAIAAAGGTEEAFSANDEAELQDALFQIVSETIQIEECNDTANVSGPEWDEDCDCPGNGAGAGDTNSDGLECAPGDEGVNEGFSLYCDYHDVLEYSTWDEDFRDEERFCADPGETECDGIDDNCDGTTDVPPATGWPAASIIGDQCYEPSDSGCTGTGPFTCEGACRAGTWACEGTGPACSGDVHPAVLELCDGVDEDCDGLTDDADNINEYSVVGAIGCGICGDGRERCVDYGTYAAMECCADTSAFGECDPVRVPEDEQCNGDDDNCNTNIDEGNPEGGGACYPAGEYGGCGNDLTGASCIGECSAGIAICDYGCTADEDNCIGEFVGDPDGKFLCQAAITPTADICDGLDNDCDGAGDDGEAESNIGQTCPSDTHPTQGECVAGTWECVTGSMECVPTSGIEIVYPSAEVCDGLDNDCDGETDEELFQACGGCTNPPYSDCTSDPNEGLCQQGIQYCDPANAKPVGLGGPAWLSCQNSILPSEEQCNSLDDDCDGLTDDELTDEGECDGADPFGCLDINPPTGECPDLRDQGDCVSGDLFCNASGQLECNETNAVGPVAETCNGTDQDCDGLTDENLYEECFTGSQGCSGSPFVCLGICRAGQRTCSNGDWGTWNGGAWDTNGCSGQVLPGTETCNNLDDDCDGTKDNNLTDSWLGTACGKGICEGTYICDTMGRQKCNMPVQPGSQPEVCDGLDNDCDGYTDEGLFNECWTDTYTVTGICHHGVQGCVYLTGDPGDPEYPWGECLGEVKPAVQEACNGLDDDCDGSTDEEDDGLAAPWHEVCNVCDDLWECVGGELVCELANPEPEICDGLDNDCDSLTDEVTEDCGGCLYSLYPEYCEEAQDPEAGVCQQGTQQCEYISGDPEDEINWGECSGSIGPSDEICDGLDNDCDCTVDSNSDGNVCNHGDDNVDEEGEIWPGGYITCQRQVGVCEGAVLRCVLDSQGEAAIECCAGVNPDGTCLLPRGPDPEEICDGLDNDCDGLTDEDLTTLCGGCDPAMYPGYDCPSGPNEGECEQGVSMCVFVGNPDLYPHWPWSECIGDTGPELEACNLLDDDCDGETDEEVVFNPPDCSLSPTDNPDEGECEPGIWVCNEGGNEECVDAVGPTIEICDGLDNDCDSETDEDLPEEGQICGSDIGMCEYGLTECVCTGPTPDTCDFECVGETLPGKEVCDALDNDCDGQTDEDMPIGSTCTNSPTGEPEGECDEGVEKCINGKWECDANWPSLEICDGLDNDCDGDTDENLEVDCPSSSICIEGECAEDCTDGEMMCPAGETCEEVRDEYGNLRHVCVDDVCSDNSDKKLPCVDNPYYCDEGERPKCVCMPVTKECANICNTVECPSSKVCIPKDGSCQERTGDCWTEGCKDGLICVGGECVDDPCYEVKCKDPQYCNNDGKCVDSCIDIDCPDGCFEGECVDDPCMGVECYEGWTCNHDTGKCEEGGKCGKVDCEFYEICLDGKCIEDPCWNVECPNGLKCIQGSCYEYEPEGGGDSDSDSDGDSDSDSDSDSDGDGDSDKDSDDDNDGIINDVLVTGLGGCLCVAAPGAGAGASSGSWIMLMAVCFAVVFVRMWPRRPKWAPAVLFVMVMGLLAGCNVEPYDFGGVGGNDTSSTDSDSDGDSDTDADTDTETDTQECDTEGNDICDHVDNDCDGETDEDFDLKTDPNNCGDCDVVCEYPDAIGVCAGGECEMGDCGTFFWDYNESDTDGCEYFCQPNATDDLCDGADIGDGSYIAKDNDCDMELDEDVDFDNDPANCGRCKKVCRFLNADALCVGGECEMGDCDDDYYDRNEKDDDGCEDHCVPDGKGEICDSNDNDCDGLVDEYDPDPKSEYGAEGGGECYTGTSGCTENAGVYTCYGKCETGKWYCESGELRCKGQVKPSSESCNNIDDDCDNSIDEEEDLDLLGPDGALCGISTGECEQGHMRCARLSSGADLEELCCASVDGNRVCAEPEKPVEVEGVEASHCDGLDNDCDGKIDEDPANENNKMTAAGDCYYAQEYGEDPGTVYGECEANPGVWTCYWGLFLCVGAKGSSPEECDNKDNDCDGSTDEDLYQDCPDPGYEEIGMCRIGKQRCQGGLWGWGTGASFVVDECGNAIEPRDEQCNNVDDDCDGNIDEIEDLEAHDNRINVPCGQGYCAGTTECENGQIHCNGNEPLEEEVPCNEVDDNCNGVTDEWSTYVCGGCDPEYGVMIGADPDDFADCVSGQPNLGQCQQGSWICQDIDTDGGDEPVCMGTILPTSETCNGEDDNCDGLTDNDAAGTGEDCSVGICAGATICNSNAEIECDWASTEPGDVVESCNNLDDDCDSTTDENVTRVCGGCDPAVYPYCTDESQRDRGECKAGIETCDGAGTFGPCLGSIDPIAETCDNKDNDCDGLTDEKVDGSPLTGSNCGLPCNDGVLTCQSGIWQCVGATVPSPDICDVDGNGDAIDNDCNANTPNGSAETWYFTACDGSDSDECDEGVYQCVNGVKTCSDNTSDSIEICDTVDNDCDGVTDSDIDPGDVPSWVCNSNCGGSTLPNPICQSGQWKCGYDCNVVECQNAPYGPPVSRETQCDGEDGDCDGTVDDDFYLDSSVTNCGTCGNECGTNPGNPLNTLDNVATYYCGSYGGQTRCLPLTCGPVGGYTAVDLDQNPLNGCECEPTATEEVPCNAVDEDCDGVVEMGTREVCDGEDNDCDALTDLADPDLQADTPSWVCNHTCPGTETEACVDTGGGIYGWECNYGPDVTVDPGTGQPTTGVEILCDGIDNDCDGLTDDGITGLRQTCTETYLACSESGAGGCDPGNPSGPVLCCRAIDANNICTDEIDFGSGEEEGAAPDNIDNDCDGLTDEGTACADSVYLTVTTPDTNTFEMFAYEASMYDATGGSAGSTGESVPCSRVGVLPWAMVTYDESRDACELLNDPDEDCLTSGGCWDLCTEEQWQYACTAGTPPSVTDTAPLYYPYGDFYEAQTCNGLDYTGVGIEEAGALTDCFGEYGTSDLYDISGNVKEWTRTPRTVGSNTLHVIRGGSYNNLKGGLTCFFDMSAGADTPQTEYRMSNLGFRCCRSRVTGSCGPDSGAGELSCNSDEWCPGGQCETCDNEQACWNGSTCEECEPYYRCGGYGVGCVLCDQTTACEENCIDCADVSGNACLAHGVDGDPQVWTECVECAGDSDCEASEKCIDNVCYQVVFKDNFTENTIDVLLSTHTPDIGTGWTLVSSSGSGTLRAAASTDDCRRRTGVDSNHAFYTANGTYATADYRARFTTVNGDTGDDLNYIVVRYQDNSNFYALEFNEGTGVLYTVVAGVWTNVGNVGAITDGSTVFLDIQGTTLSAIVNGSTKASATVSNPTWNNGKAGYAIGNLRSATADMSDQVIDNFIVLQL